MSQARQSRVVTASSRTARRATAVAAALLFVSAATAAAQVPHLSTAETFGVLAGASISNTGVTTVAGDAGVGLGGSITGDAITLSNDGALHVGSAAAVQALLDAAAAYDDLVARTCTSDLTGQDLGGMSLAPGVYCFDADAPLSGAALSLTGAGPWIFRIGGALTTSASVVVSDGAEACNGSRVFWLVEANASIGAGTTFVGSVLATSGAAFGDGAALDGRAVALDPASSVTLNANSVAACSFGNPLPAHAPVKVSGGGQIDVSNTAPDRKAVSIYGFNATPETTGGFSGHLNYVNHVSGLHVNGTVTDIDVVTIDAAGSPNLIRFSGTCSDGPDCTFSVTVDDNGEPAVNDRFGIVVVGSSADESTPHAVVRNGNIQVHLGLTTTLNADRFRPGDVLSLSLSVTPGTGSPKVDLYLVLQLPNGQLLSLTAGGLVAGLAPLAQNVTPGSFRTEIARLAIPPDAPAGTYTWLSAHTAAGTLTLVSDIAARRFTIAR